MKGVIILHQLNTYFIQWGCNEQRYEKCHHTPSLQQRLHTVRSQSAEVCKVLSYSITSIHTSYSEVTMCRGMKNVIKFHPLNKYFIPWGHNEKRCERCHRTPSPQLILHTVRSQWAGIWKLLSYYITSIDTSYSEVTMSRGMKNVIKLHPLNKYFIQCGHNENRYDRCHHTPSPQ